MTKPNVVSCLFVCQATKRFLLLKRTPKWDEGGTWCPVGGGVEDGEEPVEALRREIMEEIAYTEPFTPVFLAQTYFRNLYINQYVAFVDSEFEPVLNDEHTDWQWTRKLPALLHPGFASFWHNILVPSIQL